LGLLAFSGKVNLLDCLLILYRQFSPNVTTQVKITQLNRQMGQSLTCPKLKCPVATTVSALKRIVIVPNHFSTPSTETSTATMMIATTKITFLTDLFSTMMLATTASVKFFYPT